MSNQNVIGGAKPPTSATSSGGNTSAAASSTGTGDGPSPTVRVMRLYKPPLYTIPCLQQLSSDELLSQSRRKPTRSADFSISQFLMLPDSFGDIYLGEFFSAYISVINGVVDLPYNNVTLSARLQTINATHDLFDSRAIQGKESGRADVLTTGDSIDMVVQHTLSELGTHTLRVTVYYTDSKTNEPKTLRKFYRFNVLNPLTILVASYDLTDRFMIQCQVTNITKVLIHIQDIQLILPPLSPFETPVLIQPPQTSHPYPPPLSYPSLDINKKEVGELEKNVSFDDIFNIPSIALLNPDESYAYALIVQKKKAPDIHPLALAAARSLGNIEVNWSSSMGEHARTFSEEILIGRKVSYLPTGVNSTTITPTTLMTSPTTSTTSTPTVGTLSTRKSIETLGLHGTGIPPEQRSNTLYMEAIQIPNEGYVGVEFQITIRLTNYYSYPILSQIQHKFDVNLHQLMITGLSTMNIGALDAGESTQLTLSILPLNSGLQTLNGLIAMDLTTKIEFPVNNLYQIMIYDALVSRNMEE